MSSKTEKILRIGSGLFKFAGVEVGITYKNEHYEFPSLVISAPLACL